MSGELEITEAYSETVSAPPGATVAPLPHGRATWSPLVMNWRYPDGTMIAATIHIVGGRPRVRDVRISSETDLPLSTLRHYPLRDLVARAIAGYDFEWRTDDAGHGLVPGYHDPETGRTIVFPEPSAGSARAARRATRQRITPERLVRIAQLAAEDGGRHAARRVAEAEHCDERHARRLIEQARSLTKTQPEGTAAP